MWKVMNTQAWKYIIIIMQQHNATLSCFAKKIELKYSKNLT